MELSASPSPSQKSADSVTAAAATGQKEADAAAAAAAAAGRLTREGLAALATDLMETILTATSGTSTLLNKSETATTTTTPTVTLEDVIAQLDELSAAAPAADGDSTATTTPGGAFFQGHRDLDATFAAIDARSGKHAAVELGWSEVDFKVDGHRKQILHGCEGVIRPGDLCAIMGPSGAGKTSLMNILAGRVSTNANISVKGSITANGDVVSPRLFRRRIAYVMQDDALFATQTPREAFRFSATLRLPSDVPKRTIAQLVDNMVVALGLDKCADTMCGGGLIKGISGGERKRTAIGIELISNPSILFLDEPTSGLDSFAAFQVIKILKRLSASGRTVITTIHQPSSECFDLFEDVMLLAAGRVIYHNKVKTLPRYLRAMGHACPRNYNPADFVIFLMQQQSKTGIQALADAWESSETKRARSASSGSAGATPADVEEGGGGGGGGGSGGGGGGGGGAIVKAVFAEEEASPPSAEPPASSPAAKAGCCTQFTMLLKRECQNTLRDKGSMAARIGTTLFLNLIVGVVFQGAADWSDVADAEQNPAELITKSREHFGAVVQIFIGAMFGLAQPALISFPLERPVFIREYVLHTYGAIPYVFAKLICEIPVVIAQSALIFLVTYWLVGFQVNFLVGTLVAALMGTVAASVSLFMGAVSSSVEVAIQLVPLLFVPQLLFAGLFIPITSIPTWIQWPQYLCFLKYALNIVLIAEFSYDKANPTVPNGWNASLPVAMYENTIFGCTGDDLNDDLSCANEGPMYETALMPAVNIQPNLFWVYMGILVATFVVFRAGSLYCLTVKARL
jgi:ABC-type multidrug transport system ATPase subunit